jgi:hypothetical protein
MSPNPQANANPSSPARLILTVAVTALATSAVWILVGISAEPPVDPPGYRYTSQGWLEVSELSAPPRPPSEGWLERLPPLTCASLQLLAGLAVLVSYHEHKREQLPEPGRSSD